MAATLTSQHDREYIRFWQDYAETMIRRCLSSNKPTSSEIETGVIALKSYRKNNRPDLCNLRLELEVLLEKAKLRRKI